MKASAKTQVAQKRADLTPAQIARLRAETMLAESTIRYWAEGRTDMRESTMRILALAAAKQGIKVVVLP